MPRPVRAVDVGSVEDIDVGMSTPAAGWRLYNARDDWFKFDYGAITYYVPPDKGGELDDHPVFDENDRTPQQVVCNGELRVDDRVGRIYAVSASGGPTSKATPGKKVYDSARDIVRFAVHSFGDRGITFLTGDPRSDEARKRQARDAYLQAQVAADQYTVQAYDEHMQKWKLRPQNANRPLPMPPEPVRLARERLDQRDAARQGIRQAFKFACNICGQYATNDEMKYQTHMAVNHGQGELVKRTAEGEEPQAPDLEAAVVQPKRRGRPPKNPQPVA